MMYIPESIRMKMQTDFLISQGVVTLNIFIKYATMQNVCKFEARNAM